MSNFSYLENLIDNLSQQEGYTIPVFLLKAQIVEYAIKYLLGGYPNKPPDFIPEDFLDQATLGMAIGKLEQLHDSFLEDILADARKFNKTRREIVHHLLTSDDDIREIESNLKDTINLATRIEGGVHYFFDYISELNR